MAMNKLTLFALLLIGVLLFMGFANNSASVIDVGGKAQPPETFSFDVNGVHGEGEATIIGSFKAGGYYKGSKGSSICGTNDGDVTISNAWSVVGDSLHLKSTINNQQRNCDNVMKVKLQVPANMQITGNCVLRTSEGIDVARASCLIDDTKFDSCAGDPNFCRSGPASLNEDINLAYDSAKTIDVVLNVFVGQSGSSSAELNLNFEDLTPEEIVEVIETIENPSDSSDGQTSQSQGELSFLDKINLWFQNLWDRIFA